MKKFSVKVINRMDIPDQFEIEDVNDEWLRCWTGVAVESGYKAVTVYDGDEIVMQFLRTDV